MHKPNMTAEEALMELEPIIPADWPTFGEVVRQMEREHVQ